MFDDFDEETVRVIVAHETAQPGVFKETAVRLTLSDLLDVQSIIEKRGEPL